MIQRFVLILLVVLAAPIVGVLAGTFTLDLGPGDSADVSCAGSVRATVLPSSAHLDCLAFTPTATEVPTSTATSTSTPTPTPLPSATPSSTPTPPPPSPPTSTPTNTSVLSTATPASGVPDCVHDPTRWHSLVERNVDGSIRCTYRHEHKDDPRILDGVFGGLAQEIDYPWHAFNTRTGNPEDHRTFNWAVNGSMACKPSGQPFGFTDMRVQTHAGYNGATLRMHSFMLQAKGCDPTNPGWTDGTITMGGWFDFGKLIADAPGLKPYVIPLPDQDFWGPYAGGGERRLHGDPGHLRHDLTWYGVTGTINNSPFVPNLSCSIGIRKEDWGYIDPASPTTPHFYGPPYNGSWHDPAHVLSISVSAELDSRDGVVDGYVTLAGYTNRWGELVTGCTAPGLDCVPFNLNHMKVGNYQFRTDVQGIGARDYDVKVGGVSLIQYPN